MGQQICVASSYGHTQRAKWRSRLFGQGGFVLSVTLTLALVSSTAGYANSTWCESEYFSGDRIEITIQNKPYPSILPDKTNITTQTSFSVPRSYFFFPIPSGPKNRPPQQSENLAFRLTDRAPLNWLSPEANPVGTNTLVNLSIGGAVRLAYVLNTQSSVYTGHGVAYDKNYFLYDSVDEYGLKKVKNKIKYPYSDSEYYVFYNGSDVTDYISCKKTGSVPSPSCFHYFEFFRLTSRISYKRGNFPLWRDARNKAISILECMYRGQTVSQIEGGK